MDRCRTTETRVPRKVVRAHRSLNYGNLCASEWITPCNHDYTYGSFDYTSGVYCLHLRVFWLHFGERSGNWPPPIVEVEIVIAQFQYKYPQSLRKHLCSPFTSQPWLHLRQFRLHLRGVVITLKGILITLWRTDSYKRLTLVCMDPPRDYTYGSFDYT